jgi:endonuclease/exonuclease/phosphatase (EEP) superfamily protein YafD
MNRIIILLLVVMLLVSGCQTITNYEEPETPLFSGSFADPDGNEPDVIKAISWNVRFSEAIETGISELTTVPELQDADIILLQEMDELGVEAIARALSLNYVYYPASIHNHHERNFGNAILSEWPISEPAKIILPFENPKNGQIRTATRAIVTIGDRKILAYSVHTETVWLSPDKRSAQFETLAADIEDRSDLVIIGGDFNTATQASLERLDALFGLADLARASAGAGHTVEKGGWRFAVDHIYVRGLTPVETGVWRDTQASDHYPVWATSQFE